MTKITKHKDGTYTMHGITPDQLSLVFHLINIESLAHYFPEPYRQAALDLWNEIDKSPLVGKNTGVAYRGHKVHVAFYLAIYPTRK